MIVGHDHWACRPRSGRQYRRTSWYALGSSCTGAPRSLAQPFATKERYGCGIPLAGARPTARVRSTVVGRGHVLAVRVSGRRHKRTSLYALGSSCTGLGYVPALHKITLLDGVILFLWKRLRSVWERGIMLLNF